MPGRKYSVIVIPEGSHRVKRFTLRRSVLRTCVCLLLLVGGFIGYYAYDYVSTRVDYEELSRLRAQSFSQNKEVRLLSQKVEDLRQELIVLAQNDAKVRVMAKLARPQTDSLTAVGGPPEDETWRDLSDLQKQIDEVRVAIELQRTSQEEIQGFLNDQRSQSAAKPSGWPTRGWITSNFGMRNSPFTGRRKMHEGLDIAARTGTPVDATADGIVSRAETASGYGKLVVIDHGYGYKTFYAHNSKIFVKVGQRVKRGEKIAAVGSTGSSTGSHSHYEVRLNNVPLNPRKFL